MNHRKKCYLFMLFCLLSILSGCYSLPSITNRNQGNELYLTEIEVEIQGAVNQPGKYVLKKKSSLADIVSLAKGLREDADVLNLNMNQKLSHHDVIVIEVKTERQRISINTASIEQLQTLPGIGPKTAQLIVEYRESNGLFQTINELDHVKGIGMKKLDKLREYVKL